MSTEPAVIIVSPRCLMDEGVWEQACDMLGVSVWAVNEGQVDEDDYLTLTLDQARTLGLFDSRSLSPQTPQTGEKK